MFLYSTNAWIAYVLGEDYYKHQHFVWCATKFAPENRAGRVGVPTSSPKEIFLALAKEVAAGDKHSSKILQIKEGLKKGALVHHSRGNISDAQLAEINSIIVAAECADFSPRLYIIDYATVKARIKYVNPSSRAHFSSNEMQIENLRDGEFDVLDLFAQLN